MAVKTEQALGLSYGATKGEDDWNIWMDENLVKLGATAQISVVNKTTTTPPAVVAGERYIVGTGATGSWVSKDGQLAVAVEGAYQFYPLKKGWVVHDETDDSVVVWNGTAFVGPSADAIAAKQDVLVSGTNIKTINGSSILGAGDVDTGLLYHTESRNTAAPNATVPAHGFTATGAEANIDAVLAPKGTGALLSAVPDNTTTGGNKRGIHAVDLQTYRTSNAEVASGAYSFLGGGYGNRATGPMSCALGGENNGATATHAVLGGGQYNNTSGQYSVLMGGQYNNQNGNHSVIAGGQSNTNNSVQSFIGAGYSNDITNGSDGSVIGGGNDNWIDYSDYGFIGAGALNKLATSNLATIGGGYSNRVTYMAYGVVAGGGSNTAGIDSTSLTYGAIGGGQYNLANSHFGTIPGGEKVSTRGMYGAMAWGVAPAGGTPVGCAQELKLALTFDTADATPSKLAVRGDASSYVAGNARYYLLEDGRAATLRATVVGKTQSGEVFHAILVCGAVNEAGTVTITTVSTVHQTTSAGLATAAVAFVADSANDAVHVEVTGVAATAIRWFAVLEATEVFF